MTDLPLWATAFLSALERSGSVRVAAEAAGVTSRGAQKARLRVASFAAAWGLALRVWRAERAAGLMAQAVAAGTGAVGDHRGGEKIVRVRARARITEADEGVFLDMLCATANVRMAAAAAGASAAGFYQRRLRDGRFSTAWDAALDTARERIEFMLVEAACRTFEPGQLRLAGIDDGAAGADVAPLGLPAVTIDEAIRILGMAKGRKPGSRPSYAELARRGDEARAKILWKLDNIARHAAAEKARLAAVRDGASTGSVGARDERALRDGASTGSVPPQDEGQ